MFSVTLVCLCLRHKAYTNKTHKIIQFKEKNNCIVRMESPHSKISKTKFKTNKLNAQKYYKQRDKTKKKRFFKTQGKENNI